MALPKRTRIGGGYYEGYTCPVLSAPGNYTVIVSNTSGAALNGLSITPDEYGAGDYMKVEHFNDAAGTGSCMAVLATNVHNAGANSSITLDFPAMELVERGECIKFTYVNTASIALNVYLIAEFVGIKKTA